MELDCWVHVTSMSCASKNTLNWHQRNQILVQQCFSTLFFSRKICEVLSVLGRHKYQPGEDKKREITGFPLTSALGSIMPKNAFEKLLNLIGLSKTCGTTTKRTSGKKKLLLFQNNRRIQNWIEWLPDNSFWKASIYSSITWFEFLVLNSLSFQKLGHYCRSSPSGIWP